MGSYQVDVIARTKKFQQEMAKLPGITEAEATKAAVKLGAALEKGEQRAAAAAQSRAEKAAQRAASYAKKTSAATFTVTAGDIARLGSAVADYAQHLADANNRLTDTSARTGVAVETIKGLDLAFTGSGLAASNVEAILKKFPKTLGDIARGTGEALPAIERLFGKDGFDADGALKDSDAALRQIIKQLSAVEAPAEQAALAAQLFGRTGGELLQAGVLGSADALDVFIGHADRWGLETGPEATKQAAQFQRALAELALVAEGSASQLAAAFGIDAAQKIQDFTAGLVAAFEAVRFGATFTAESLVGMAAVIDHLARGGSLEGVRDILGGVNDRLSEAATAGIEAAKSFREGQKAIDDLGGATGDVTGELDEMGTALSRQSAAQKEAAAAAREHAAELRSVEQALAQVSKANEKFIDADSIEAQRDRALAAVDDLAARTIEAGLLTAEADQTLALRRAAIWSDYYDTVDERDAEAVERALELREARQERFRE